MALEKTVNILLLLYSYGAHKLVVKLIISKLQTLFYEKTKVPCTRIRGRAVTNRSQGFQGAHPDKTSTLCAE
jgi:hypothetical protein